MEPLDAVWHLLNFLVPALSLGFFSSGLAKLFWRTPLKRVSWLRLFTTSSAAAALMLVGGLIVFGHDGRIGTYVGMVLAAALSLWWAGFRPLRGPP